MTQPLLEMRGICKRFGATVALSDVSFNARPGQVLALIGENGAGKSTLMKVLSGACQPERGRMTLAGEPYAPRGPLDARRRGVAMIYQELNLAPALSVEDNIMLGQETHRLGVILRGRQRERVREALALLGHAELRSDAPAGRLSVAAQQLVEIARALVMDARLIVFDEPTSSLTRRDVEHLFEVIARLKASGRAVIYISHFLEEIRQVADHFTVLRDGQVAGAGVVGETTEAELVALMVGRNIEQLFPKVPHELGEEILRVEGLSGGRAPHDLTISLKRGEILGLAGLVGAGRTELVRCLYGLDSVRAGRIRLAGAVVEAGPRAAIGSGMGFVSEDRKSEGLLQMRDITDNTTLSRLSPYARLGWLHLGRRRKEVSGWISRLGIRAAGPEQPVHALSGGNQQKVALARVLHQNAEVLLLDEPTRGVDVGTKAEIYRLIGEQAAAGKAVVFISSYLPELLAVCDRVAVMARGRLRDVRPVDQWTEHSIMACAVSGSETPA